MTYIPKVAEQEYQRRIRSLSEKVDELSGKVDKLSRSPIPIDREVPEAVKMAFAFCEMFRDTNAETGTVNPFMGFAVPEVSHREPTPGELAALGSACELIEDYFDRHNTRIIRERLRADALNRAKPVKAIPVSKEKKR